MKKYVCFLFIFLLLCCFAEAGDFSVKNIGDYGNVAVMEVTGNYDAKNQDGTLNSVSRQAIAKEFLKTHKDEYDFIVIFSNFDFQMPDGEAEAFYLHVRNDTQGIGKQLFDNSSLFGSNGKLQGIIDMGNISSLITDPLNPEFEETLSILAHEQMHRWGAYVKFRDSNGNISPALLGKDDEHWSFLLDTRASVLYGNKWKDNANGTFTSIAANKYYSPLDLYLMGLHDKTHVPPMLLISSPDTDPAKAPQMGATVAGSPQYINIENIIAAEGERIPGATESQKTFKAAFILITAPETFTGYEVYEIENIRNSWVTRFSILTDGKALAQVVLSPIEDVPVNPGDTPPSIVPRTLPPDIEDGVRWLMKNQKPDGSWMDSSLTAGRDTAEAVYVLKKFEMAGHNYSLGLDRLTGNIPENTDYLARKIEAFTVSGRDVTPLVNNIISRQNPDGGWGSSKEYASSAPDTALVLKALSNAGVTTQAVIEQAIEYLKTRQNSDGGWGSDAADSAIETTAHVLSAFNKYRNTCLLDDPISKGVAWLMRRQNPDGGFGPSTSSGHGISTIYDSALAAMALKEFGVSSDVINSSLNYILNNQSEDGSWYESSYQTALAVDAVWKTTMDPDLSVKSEDITFIPDVINTLPTNVVMNVNIRNIGRTAVPQANIILYKDAVNETNKIGEQILAFPGQSSVTATFFVAIPDGNEHKFYVSVDSENLVKESDETNNTAVNVLKPQATYDFEILPSDITVSHNPVDIFQDVTITSKITNKGTMNAYNVRIKYYIDEAGIPFDIATKTVDVPANATISNEVIWHANKAGENLPINVFADPFNNFTELSEDNNKAAIYLTVDKKDFTNPNLTLSYEDIATTPNPANEHGNATISTLLKNEGFSSAQNIKVNFYKGVPGQDGILLGTKTVSSIEAGESCRVSIEWNNIMESGERIVYIAADPDNQITEISEDDNEAFTVLKILSLPDLTISPSHISFNPPSPKEGDIVSINSVIQNKGGQSAKQVIAAAYEGNVLIESKAIPSIEGNSQTGVSFEYNTSGKEGAHRITIAVDPGNDIPEQSEDNNSAAKTFGLQDANFRLSEQYISPNGDGVKDSTEFFFRLGAPREVRVLIVNGKNETVRTLSGGEFEDVSAINIIWDGLNDDGIVVNDGQYQIKVIDPNNNLLGSLLVSVDNNRSPLTEAIGTSYLLNRNLTCAMPRYDSADWFPDERGLIISIGIGAEEGWSLYGDNQYKFGSYNPPYNGPYSRGIYTVSIHGDGINKITPWTQTVITDNEKVRTSALSPDGEKVAFVILKHGQGLQLWVVNTDGTKLTLLDSPAYKLGDYLWNIVWSPDSKFISYFYSHDEFPYMNCFEELWIANVVTKEKIRIERGGEDFFNSTVQWSPDSSRIAYGTPVAIKTSDTSGYARDILNSGDRDIQAWLNNSNILIESWSEGLEIIDADDSGSITNLSRDKTALVSVSPDKKYVSYETWQDYSPGAFIIYDADGNENIYRLQGYRCDRKWSPDSIKVAAFDQALQQIMVLNLKTGEERLATVNNNGNCLELTWLSDNSTILATGFPNNTGMLINTETGEQTLLPVGNKSYSNTNWVYPYSTPAKISTMGNYIAYLSDINETKGCYSGAYRYCMFPYYGWCYDSDYRYYGKEKDIWITGSLLNLTADLSIIKGSSAVTLKGTAQDLNFESYKLEYESSNTPGVWKIIATSSETPVVDDVFNIWAPPCEGLFHVRLTVQDKAGNTATNTKSFSWGQSSSLTGLYKNHDVFSPNNDSIKDTVELHYTVLEPVHLEFSIYDENGKPVRTFLKDHAGAGDDFITWDGQDSEGKIVPDGKYTIKIFDFEFFVEVDNSPPEVGLHLIGPEQDYDKITGVGQRILYIEIKGHAIDSNIEKWVIEYGEGDNPQNWHTLAEGTDLLTGRDELGNPAVNPVEDVTIDRYQEADIEFFTGKKLKITAEDFAGNRSTTITGFLEEKMLLYKYDDTIIPLSLIDDIYPELAVPGVHTLAGLETIRLELSSINVQYGNNGQWFDAPYVNNPASGLLSLQWDNTLFGPARAVRIKAVDILGQEHYSNEILIDQAFYIDTCALKAEISIFEDTKLIRLQVQSNQDNRYAQWTDYKVFDAEKGDIMPKGIFTMPVPELEPGMNYKFKMTGVGVSGRSYLSNIAQYPENCLFPPVQVDFSLHAGYKETDCGLISDGQATLSAEIKGLDSGIFFKTLGYYIQNPDGLELLREFDLTKEAWGNVVIDTLNLAEGSYSVKAVLDYIDLNRGGSKKITAGNSIIVDRVLPTAKINWPGKSLTVCPVTVADYKGNWPGISIEGIAEDNINVRHYDIYYSPGSSPLLWIPANTRVNGKRTLLSANCSRQGQLGLWDITGISGQDLSVKLKVTDYAGNLSCDTVNFSVDGSVEIADLATDKNLFSPNSDGSFEHVTINYTINEYSTTDVRIYPLTENADGTKSPGAVPVRTVVSGLRHTGGNETALWDGRDDSGIVVADGYYAVAVSATDACGNTAQEWLEIEVDKTPPAAVIVNPKPGEPAGNIIEITGTADDPHFADYIIETGSGESPNSWSAISSDFHPVHNGLLGTWNAFGLDGIWTIRLTAVDTVANKNIVSVIMDLGQRQTLVKDFDAVPMYFSPDNDGRADTSTIYYNLADSCDIQLDILNDVDMSVKTYTADAPAAGTYSFIWDGFDNTGATVPDGLYKVRLRAALSADASIMEEEVLTVVADSTPPFIDLRQPLHNQVLQGAVIVSGTISDTNLGEYSISYINDSGSSGAILLDKANQSRVNHVFGTINNLDESSYVLNVTASDLAGNTMQKNLPFTVDRTPPKVVLDNPKEGDIYGLAKDNIEISGSVQEKNPELFSLRYGPGDNPSQWTELWNSDTLPVTPTIFSWSVGKNEGIPDGLYTLSLYAKDKAGIAGESKVKVIIDNNPPLVSITSPRNGEYIASALDIKGTATDPNFDKYTLELSEGQCGGAYKWASLKNSNTQTKDGTLASWKLLPSDGNYCLRLTATDRAGNKADTKTDIIIDASPPAAPVLNGAIENRSCATLVWSRNSEADLAGYNLYRDFRKINTAIIRDIVYADPNLKEAIYTYTITALDLAGNESKPSNEVKLRVDVTPPEAKIFQPKDGSGTGGLVDVRGTAYSSDDFRQYRLFIGQSAAPLSWSLVRTSPAPIQYDTFYQWDTTKSADGTWSIKLEADDLSGNINTHQITITVDNAPPASPVLVSAVQNASDITITWKPNNEPDLAGYILFRNEQPANVAGPVTGSLKPYLLSSANYIDKALPDGRFIYYLTAMDQSGNISSPSNSLAVILDVHPPHATIVDPKDWANFQERLSVRAESTDTDIAFVQFQYKKEQDAGWINLGSPINKAPYITYFDPPVIGLPYGNYNLRAVATDTGGKADPSPSHITVVYADSTPPNAPQNLKAVSDGRIIRLEWKANTEPDLSGYNIYKITGRGKNKINSSVVKQTGYQDEVPSEGVYTYEVTAVDTQNNESSASAAASAVVYAAPRIDQPYTPTGEGVVQILGHNAAAPTAEIFSDTGSGFISAGNVSSGADGNFIFSSLIPVPGENRITAKVKDSNGNISISSNMVIVVYNEPPSAPAGLTASVQEHNVRLNWTPDTESDISGYNLYRNETKLNATVPLNAGSTSASASYENAQPYMAFDGEPSTSWEPYISADPYWWQIDLPFSELINSLEIQWLAGMDRIYGGKDFEIQAWSGYAWITIAEVSGNSAKSNTIELNPSYRTDKIRLYITDTILENRAIAVNEISILKDNLITDTEYIDADLGGGTYNYKVKAVDYYGFPSLPSDEAQADIEFVRPAPPVNLLISPLSDGNSLRADWESADSSTSVFNIYRSTTAGGPYTKINNRPMDLVHYIDVMLETGVEYFYVVTSVNEIGVESLYSNEAAGIPERPSALLPAPVLFFPTISGLPVTLEKSITDISGTAENALLIELFKNSEPAGSATALDKDVAESHVTGSIIWDMSLSPDGKPLAYVTNEGYLWLKNLNNGESTCIARSAFACLWSPDGKIIVYQNCDTNSICRLNIYDVASAVSQPLTDDTARQIRPMWLPDSSRIAFLRYRESDRRWELLIKDLVSGSLMPVTESGEAQDYAISPDGGKIAVMEGMSLNVIDLQNGGKMQLQLEGWSGEPAWSPDSKKIAFSQSNYDKTDIFVADIKTLGVNILTDSSGDSYKPVWSPDGRSIVFVRYESQNDLGSLWVTSTQSPEASRLIAHFNSPDWNAWLISWRKTGEIIYYDGDKFYSMRLKGFFNFEDIQTDEGENVFNVIASNEAGSVVSGDILVACENGYDLEIAESDISAEPSSSFSGGIVRVSVTVRNIGKIDINDAAVDIKVSDSGGNISLIKSASLPLIKAGSEEIVAFDWQCNGIPGEAEIITMADPDDRIWEADEFNNTAIKRITILGDTITLSATAIEPGNNIMLQWSPAANPNLSGYNIYRKNSGDWSRINSAALSGTTYTDSNLLNGTYTYIVKALGTDGTEGLPSNEATATAYIAPPQAPQNMKVTSLAGGGALEISWLYDAGSISGFNLYRSTISGGPYEKIAFTEALTIIDRGLTNDTTYYYVVTAVDVTGNESAYSCEAAGIPAVNIKPSAPFLFFPTITGIPVVTYDSATDVSGFAKGSLTVELMENSVSVGLTAAFNSDITRGFSIEKGVNDLSLSPDGKTLAYTKSGAVWLQDLAAGSTTKVIEKGRHPLWSPDAGSLAYSFIDDKGNYRTGIYNINSGLNMPLTDDEIVYEDQPFWSSDGSEIVFISNRAGANNVWLKDLVSGSLVQLSNTTNASFPKLSPDSGKLSYFVNSALYIFDLPEGGASLIDSSADRYYSEWSPDGKKLLFVSYKNRDSNIFVYDVDKNERLQITDSPGNKFYPVWSPDGGYIVFANSDDYWTYSIIEHSPDGDRVLKNNIEDLGYMSWAKSGPVAYFDFLSINLLYPEGYFNFRGVRLESGENIFHAVSTDATGNTSEPSGGISVIFDAEHMPDLEISEEDLFLYPPSPVSGEQVLINAYVRNKGQTDVRNVKVDIYLTNAGGDINLLVTEIIPSMTPGSEEVIVSEWDSKGTKGENRIIAVIDSFNGIAESDETNNIAFRDFVVAESEGVSMSTTLNAGIYRTEQDVKISIKLSNAGIEKDVKVSALIEDESGNSVEALNPVQTNLPYAVQKDVELVWNTRVSFAGNYRVHTVLTDSDGSLLQENSAAFAILPEINISASVTADKAAFNQGETVFFTVGIRNSGRNYIIPELEVNIRITDINNVILFIERKMLASLLPGGSSAENFVWNTSMNPAGTYPVILEVKDSGGSVLSCATTTITINKKLNPTALLRGRITVDRQSVLKGEPVSISYVVDNIGNINLPQVDLFVLVPYTADRTVHDTLTDQTSLNAGGSYSNTKPLPTESYSAMDYLVILRAGVSGIEETLAGTYFRIEGAPSAPSLHLPQHGSDVETYTPVLSVNNASDPNNDRLAYEFEIYSASSLVNPAALSGMIAERENITSWGTPVNLTENRIYYWRARAYDGLLYGEWMTPAMFRVNVENDPPAAPTLSAPADNSAVDTFTPMLLVNNAADPDSTNLTYNFELALDRDFAQIVESQTGIFEGQGTTSCNVTVPLSENTTYYWRAQADDWLIKGPWMTPAKFFINTANDAPSAPVIISPANNTEVSTLHTDITASNSIDPDSAGLVYIFEMDTSATFDSSNLLKSDSIPEGQAVTIWSPSTGSGELFNMSDNTFYHVRAKANDGSAESPWSEVARFFVNTQNDAPTAPVLSNPSDGAGINTFTPTLSVHNSSDIDGDVLVYEFELYADAAMTNLIAAISGVEETPDITSWTAPATLAENGVYYWRARAYDGELHSSWTSQASFMVNTANDAPSAPVLYSPAEGSSLDRLNPVLSVSNAADPDSDNLFYEFEIYSKGALIQSINGISGDNSGITSVAAANLSDNTTYTWRARAYDGDCYGAWMDMATFSIHLPVTNITATIDFDPNTLNRKSKGNWVTVYIELPSGYKAADIAISSIRLNGTIRAESWPYNIGDYDRDGIPDLMVKFKRAEVISLLPNGDNVQVLVTGTTAGTAFEGVDVIRVIH